MAKSKEQGVLALFDDPANLVEAVKGTRKLNITKMDCFTPFPIHGLEKVMGLKRSWIPWATLVLGLTGASLLFLFQAWTSAIDWPINVGGKPFVSWPAFIPITFEGTILFGGVGTVLTLFATLKLPNRVDPPLDPRITNNMFGLFVEDCDPQFSEAKLSEVFKSNGVVEIKKIEAGREWD